MNNFKLKIKNVKLRKQIIFMRSVHSQMVDFGSWHMSRHSLQAKTEGYSVFETGGIACYFEDFKKIPIESGQGPKDAFCGWTLIERSDSTI
jgi:hypothetical protein